MTTLRLLGGLSSAFGGSGPLRLPGGRESGGGTRFGTNFLRRKKEVFFATAWGGASGWLADVFDFAIGFLPFAIASLS
jgi:hypothetical protein